MTLTLGPRDLALTHSREASAQRKVRANHTAQRKSGRSPMRLGPGERDETTRLKRLRARMNGTSHCGRHGSGPGTHGTSLCGRLRARVARDEPRRQVRLRARVGTSQGGLNGSGPGRWDES